MQTVLSLVESSLGVAPVLSVMPPDPHIVYRPIADLSPAAGIGLALVLPELASPAAQRFREVALRGFAAV